MAGRISTGWSIVKQSWSVLRRDKELMLFPVLSAVASVVVAVSFIAPFLILPEWGRQVLQSFEQKQAAPLWKETWAYAVLFAFYVVNYFVIAFCNTALVSCAITRMSGGEPTVGDGLRAAGERWHLLLGWSVCAATVGLVLKMIESRSKLIGQIVAGVLGLMWTVATYFIVPILAVERIGPISAVRRSVELLRRTWGEGLVGNMTMNLIGLLLGLLAIPLFLAAFFGGTATGNGWVFAAGAAVTVAYLLGLSIVMSTLRQIFIAGLYTYAAQQRVPDGFSEGLLRSAFRPK